MISGSRTKSSLFALGEAEGGERRAVGRVGVAAAGEEGLLDLLQVLDLDRRELHVVEAEVVGDGELGAGARLHADGGAVELLGAISRWRISSPGSRCRHRSSPRRTAGRGSASRPSVQVVLADEQVDLARLQRGEAVLRRGAGRSCTLLASPKHRGGDGAAAVGVDAAHHALAVGQREAGDAGGDAADELAALAHRVERGRAGAAGDGGRGRRRRAPRRAPGRAPARRAAGRRRRQRSSHAPIWTLSSGSPEAGCSELTGGPATNQCFSVTASSGQGLPAAAGAATLDAMQTLFANARIVDAAHAEPREGHVLVEDGVIRDLAARPVGGARPAGARPARGAR